MTKVYALRIEQSRTVLGNLVMHSCSDSELQKSYQRFVDQLAQALNDCSLEKVKITLYPFDDLENKKISMLAAGKKYLNFDSQSVLGISFGVSRCFDLTTQQQLGITSRPGYDDLNQQILSIRGTYGTEFGIIEDDIFSGGTLTTMIRLLNDAGLEITSVVSSISSTDTIGESIAVSSVVYHDKTELLELTDPRDYIFRARHGGLVVSYNGIKTRLPYDAMFIDIATRASLRKSKLSEFTKMVRDANVQLHQSIGTIDYPLGLFYPLPILARFNIQDNTSIRELLEQQADIETA